MLDVHRSVSQYRIPKSESDAEREGDSEVKGGTMGLGFLLQKVWQSNNRCILEPAIHPVEGLCFIFARNNRKNLITHGRIV